MLEHRGGGPRLPMLVLAALTLGLALATTVVWLAALGVRERALLADDPLIRVPRMRLRVLVMRALLLFSATSIAFAYFESFIHWRTGLGWHGLHCLTGPVHRDAIPILGALSLVAAAVFAAVEHVLAWIRRTIARIAAAPRAAAPSLVLAMRGREFAVRSFHLAGSLGARAPPLFAC